MLKKTTCSMLAALFFLSSQFLFGQDVIQKIGDAGYVDWGSRVIRATGVAGINPNMPAGAQRAGALEAAKYVALRNLLQVVQGMYITSETTVRNASLENDVIQSRIQGAIRTFRIVGEPRYMSDQSIEIDVEVPLDGVLSESLLPVSDFKGQSTVNAGAGGYTGLVILAKGLNVMPAMAPKVLDEDGREVYGSSLVSREWALKHGMVGYAKSVAQARKNERVKANPLVVRALRASGDARADLVISNEDAQKIRDIAEYQSFLSNCRVMFVVD